RVRREGLVLLPRSRSAVVPESVRVGASGRLVLRQPVQNNRRVPLDRSCSEDVAEELPQKLGFQGVWQIPETTEGAIAESRKLLEGSSGTRGVAGTRARAGYE